VIRAACKGRGRDQRVPTGCRCRRAVIRVVEDERVPAPVPRDIDNPGQSRLTRDLTIARHVSWAGAGRQPGRLTGLGGRVHRVAPDNRLIGHDQDVQRQQAWPAGSMTWGPPRQTSGAWLSPGLTCMTARDLTADQRHQRTRPVPSSASRGSTSIGSPLPGFASDAAAYRRPHHRPHRTPTISTRTHNKEPLLGGYGLSNALGHRDMQRGGLRVRRNLLSQSRNAERVR
jgi:hypothetical protein